MAGLKHTTLAEVNFESTSDGTRAVVEESAATMERLSLSSAKEDPSCSGAGASLGCASLPSDPTHSSSEYFSTRIESIVESKSELKRPWMRRLKRRKVIGVSCSRWGVAHRAAQSPTWNCSRDFSSNMQHPTSREASSGTRKKICGNWERRLRREQGAIHHFEVCAS
ncbi:hypothetical protein M758_UG124000 [Ceratodon purpureus]|nr:hypothetical protein M758_UG124000 [Ceratodon purpureus]